MLTKVINMHVIMTVVMLLGSLSWYDLVFAFGQF